MAVSEKKVQEALAVLKEGGKFVYKLEQGYFRNQSVFKWSLIDSKGYKVKGFSAAVYYALADQLERSDGFYSSTRKEYSLKEGVEA